LDIESFYDSGENFLHRYLFDKTNNNSLISALEYASGNATLLREEIKSETYAYIQLSICHIERCSINDSDVDALQLVTDSLLAFWGSVDERMYKRDARNMLKAGKYVESLDLHIRFGYPLERIIYLLDRVEKHTEKEKAIFDQAVFSKLKSELLLPNYNKANVLALISRLFLV
jgi:uncharacterized alpha-E superfamily protein